MPVPAIYSFLEQKKHLAFFLSCLTILWAYHPAAAQSGNQTVNSTATVAPGAVVESISKGTEGERSGLQPGDLILSWSCQDRHGTIESPFDIATVTNEQATLGPVTLEGIRASQHSTWTLATNEWGLGVRPAFAADLGALYSDGEKAVAGGNLDQAFHDWDLLDEKLRNSSAPWVIPWLLVHQANQVAGANWEKANFFYKGAIQSSTEAAPILRAKVFFEFATALRKRGDFAAAEKYYQESIAQIQTLPDFKMTTAGVLLKLGGLMRDHGDLAAAERYFQKTLTLRKEVAPDSLPVSDSLNELGIVASMKSDYDTAEQYYLQSLAIRKSLAPDRLPVAATFINLARLSDDRGDLDKAEEYLRQALEIQQRIAPGSGAVAASLNNLGWVEKRRGNLSQAEQDLQQSLEITQKFGPVSLAVAGILNNLGEVVHERGDFKKAEDYLSRALKMKEQLAPKSNVTAETLGNLAELALDRGDFEKADQYIQRALTLFRGVAPDSVEVAMSFLVVGRISVARGDLPKAEDSFLQALSIERRRVPNDLETARTLSNLADVRLKRGDLPAAERYLDEALKIAHSHAPKSTLVASILNQLADTAYKDGDFSTAEVRYREAADIQETLIPAAERQAETLAQLARIIRQKGDMQEAAKLFNRSLNILETHAGLLGGRLELQAGFRAKYADVYEECIDLLVSNQQIEEAFHVLERLKARTLLETLSLAHVDLRNGTDPAVVERERTLAAEIRIKSERRSELIGDSSSPQQIAAIEKQISELVRQREDVEAQIRDSSPAFAALVQPLPLTAKEVQRRLLDPDTVLLEYSLGEKRSYVFFLTSNSIRAYALPRQATIERAARRVYQMLTARSQQIQRETPAQRQARVSRAEEQYVNAAAALSRMIVGPVARQVKAKRLLVVSDGALQYIPFGILPASSQHPAPLIVDHEIVSLPSASVLATLRRSESNRKPALKSVAVLADPVFSKQDARVSRARIADSSETPSISLNFSSAELDHSTRDVGLVTLHRLAFSRQEAEAILSAAPDGSSFSALDFKASRSTAINPELRQYQVVHFATHGLLDSQHPELSGLVLSLVDEQGNPQNGFMTLDDIYNLEWPVDMVVLSACETGLGQEVRGEGLIGLIQGFMYAGANRVVATLWSVDDAATAAFMRDFYKAMLQQNLPPAAALRKTQVQMWKQKRWNNPYYWGGFTIQGEWMPPAAHTAAVVKHRE